MNTKEVLELRQSVARLEKKIAAISSDGIREQKRQALQLSEIKVTILDAHENEKKKLKNEIELRDQIIKAKDIEIAELKPKKP